MSSPPIRRIQQQISGVPTNSGAHLLPNFQLLSLPHCFPMQKRVLLLVLSPLHLKLTRIQINVATGRIAVLSPLAAANAFVDRCVGLVTMSRNMIPQKRPFPWGIRFPI